MDIFPILFYIDDPRFSVPISSSPSKCISIETYSEIRDYYYKP